MCTCCLLNARSIVNKTHELHYLLYRLKYDFIFITETWLHSEISSGLLDPQSEYCVLRKDRVGSPYGGVAAFVHRNFCVREISIANRFTMLELCFDLLLGSESIRFFVVYRPPTNAPDPLTNTQLLIECLEEYSHGVQTAISVGDLNFPKINWNVGSSGDSIGKVFLDFVTTNSFHQFVNFSKRASNTLDLILANDDQVVCSVFPKAPLGHSDHCCIDFKVCNFPTPNISSSKIYNWYKADFDSMAAYLDCVDWNSLICYNPEASSSWCTFLELIWSAVELFVPPKSNKMSRFKRHPKEVRKIIGKKHQLWKKCREYPTDLKAHWAYRSCTNEVRAKCRDMVNREEEAVISSKNVGDFYRYINKRLSHRDAIGALVDDSGNVITSCDDKANMFNSYYASAGTVDNGQIPAINNNVILCSVAETVTFAEAEVMKAFNKLKPNLSSGPDNLPPLLFKRLKYSMAKPLALLYNQLMSVGYVPDSWKNAFITPVYKKGPAESVKNYRPISLTCVAGKIMERLVANEIYRHLQHNDLLSSVQHGFVKGKSTCTNLLECFNDWTQMLQNKSSVTVAYIDFTKAFDSVSHKKLFTRLHLYGIRGNLLQWIRNFLTDRTHQTRVGWSLSKIAALLSGIVQGSGLGPVLFLIYIDDLAKVLEKSGVIFKFFADDVKLYLEVKNVQDCDTVQRCLDLVCAWARDWQLQISIEKCNVLHIGRCLTDRKYYIDCTELSAHLQCKDLGITVTNDLVPQYHINEIVSKAHRRANSILRCFATRDNDLFVRAFMVYVRPILEYNSVVWSPSLIRDIDQIEKVQRRFTKRLFGMRHLTYEARLQQLCLTRLELRRLHLDLLFCYRIVFGLVSVKCEDFFEFASVMTTRGHAYKLYKPRCTSAVRYNFFTERVIDVWNNLPLTVNFASLMTFRRSIEDVDFTKYIKSTS